MTAWTDEELNRVGQARELQLASVRKDGCLRPYVTMWVVRVGDDLYIRSPYRPNNRGSVAPRPAVPVAPGRVVPSETSRSPKPTRTFTTLSTPPTTPSMTSTGPRSWGLWLAPKPRPSRSSSCHAQRRPGEGKDGHR